MKTIIVTSSKDEASLTIRDVLLANFSFQRNNRNFEKFPTFTLKENSNIGLITTERELVNAEHLDSLNADLFIFASKHRSESGIPALLTHFPGNWTNDALLGGKPKTLGLAAAGVLKIALRKLKEDMEYKQLRDYKVSVEATHHGPTTLKSATIFIELGSGPNEWRDEKAAGVVAATCLAAATSEESYPSALAFGSSHYSPRFTELIQETEVALSHIVPRHALNTLEKEMIQQAIEKTVEAIEFFVIDQKGMTSLQRRKVEGFAKELGYPIKRARKMMKATK
ncbi:MAG: D-aminoacyl-tRNA deacylase [Candidatus Hodarchaeota archaeon]